MSKKVHIDQEECIGCELCAQMCPGVFEMQEDGKSKVINHKGASEAEIQQAIDSCPVQSIEWVEE